ncbi:hypothetical protein F5Y17DRAFT_19571 [Xylariaceae sp. FL0594]|nr:hypothetical protein F5Y17DRAFT_19571 [Xylariaceae sp. FL0594]
MPLSLVSPNVKGSESVAQKRSGQELLVTACCDTTASALCNENFSTSQKSPSVTTSLPPASCQTQNTADSSPLSSQASCTEADLSTSTESTEHSIQPSAPPPKITSSTPPTQTPATMTVSASAGGKKRKVLAPLNDQERAEKKQKQEEAAAEKAKILAEKHAAKVEKEAARAAKAAEKARIDAEKEAARAAKAAEKAKADAAKEAKEAATQRSKNMLFSFLNKPQGAAATKPGPDSSAMTNPGKADPSLVKPETETAKSAYEKSFKPFFVKPGVTMAPAPFEMDLAAKEAKLRVLDEFICGGRVETETHPFNPAKIFNTVFPKKRGIVPPSVRKIMAVIHGDACQVSFSMQSKSDSQTEKLYVNAQDQLNSIPMKYLRFHEDVRPAYFGTITTPMEHDKLHTLARRPAGKILPLAYDYDSEAEWIEDDGEDLDDAEDEEEDLDGDEEMDDFVDDSEAIPTIVRPGFEADSQPVSTGLCFEDGQRIGPCDTTYGYRLEFLLETLERHSMIDPFSTDYWPAPVKKTKPTTVTTATKGKIASMLAPATQQCDVVVTPAPTSVTLDGKDTVPRDILEDFKRALISDECKGFSKSTVIELLAKKFPSCTKAQVKATIDMVAHRVTPPGEKKKSVKEWALLDQYALKQS